MESTAAAAESDAGSHAGTLDLTDNMTDNDNDAPAPPNTEHIEQTEVTGDHPDRSRRYGGPILAQIMAGIIAFGLLAVTVALSASSLRKSNEAFALATANSEAIEEEKLNFIAEEEAAAAAAAAAAGNDGAQSSAPTASVKVTTTTSPTPKPTNTPTLRPTTAAPTEPHPLNPQWFQTTHADYEEFKEANADNPSNNHEWTISNMVCSKNDRFLCNLDAYCPNGKGSEPFNGGPPTVYNSNTLEETQWAPYLIPNEEWGKDPAIRPKSHWVQIGLLPASDGGSNENDFLKCWTYDDWYVGGGGDIAENEEWGEEHRMWLLCCENAEEKGGDPPDE